LDLPFGETFIILVDRRDWRFAIGKVSIIDEEESGVRVVFKIENMKAFWTRLEFDHPHLRENPEYTPVISAVINHLEFLTQLIQ